MYLDFEDHRPDTPRIPKAVTVREAVLASLLFHALVVIAYLVWPVAPVAQVEAQLAELPDRPAVEYVHIMPTLERPRTPPPDAPASDLDRRASSPVKPPDANNSQPFAAGNTSERVVGAPDEKVAGPDTAPPAPPPPPSNPATASGVGPIPSDVAPGQSSPPPQPPATSPRWIPGAGVSGSTCCCSAATAG